jgi:DHA1 family arabinose polymer transporter-like MFS transporter
MKKTIVSLALGTFGLGMAEFGIMGVLTELAKDVGITIPSAGNMISFYALVWSLAHRLLPSFPANFP